MLKQVPIPKPAIFVAEILICFDRVYVIKHSSPPVLSRESLVAQSEVEMPKESIFRHLMKREGIIKQLF